MSNPEELEELMPGEHKRQREALRRKINSNKGGQFLTYIGQRL